MPVAGALRGLWGLGSDAHAIRGPGIGRRLRPLPDAPVVGVGLMPRYLDLSGVARRTTKITRLAGGIRPWSEAQGLHPSVVDHFLRGQRGPSPQLLEAVGLRKVVLYQIIGGK